MTIYEFSAFTNADLFGEHPIATHAHFIQPAAATLQVRLTDDDAKLSGDAFRNERGDDTSGQTATLTNVFDGEDIGNGGRLYAERIWHVFGDDNKVYVLAELEQPGVLPDSFTYVGAVPPAGTALTVGASENVIAPGLSYANLSAGDLVAPEPDPAPNIVEIAAGSDDFNILVQALSAAGLVETVQNATDITVFAPTDAAFTQLALDLGFDGDAQDEGAIFGFIAGALAGLAPDGDPIPLLTNILTYHVSPGAKTAAEIDAAGTITTLLTDATFSSEGSELVDNEPDIANPSIVAPDISASNGTIQVIDRVLLPIDIPGNTPEPAPTLAGLVAASGGEFDDNLADFDVLLNAVQAADLAGALDDPEADLTVFAPNDAAFVGLAQALGFDGSDEGAAFAYLVEALALLNEGDPIPLLKSVLLYHVAPQALDSTAVLAASEIETLLSGASLGVDGATLVDAEPDVPNPNLIATDLTASNGIAHVVDGVLLPADLLQSDGANDVDFIIGSDAREVVWTGADNDFFDGNGGNDAARLGKGNDVAFGGDGNDLLVGGRGDDALSGDAGRDVLRGGLGEDNLSGGGGNDVLFGGRDNDLLQGNAGNDSLRGGGGDDTLIGGTGNDHLFGGRGADTFVFNSGDGLDKIIGFEQGSDKIDLTRTDITSSEDLLAAITTSTFGAEIALSEDQAIFVLGFNLELGADDFILSMPIVDDSLL